MSSQIVELDDEVLSEFAIGSNFLKEKNPKAASAACDAVKLRVRMMTVHGIATVFMVANPGLEDIVVATRMGDLTVYDEHVTVECELDWLERNFTRHVCLL